MTKDNRHRGVEINSSQKKNLQESSFVSWSWLPWYIPYTIGFPLPHLLCSYSLTARQQAANVTGQWSDVTLSDHEVVIALSGVQSAAHPIQKETFFLIAQDDRNGQEKRTEFCVIPHNWLETHNNKKKKKAILRWKDRKNGILSGGIQNTPLAMLVGRSGHCPVPRHAIQCGRAVQLPAETSQALAHSSWCWESRCSFEITAF